MNEELVLHSPTTCSKDLLVSVNDALNVISGKWKLLIIGALFFGKKRYKDLSLDIPRITPRMLSKELKELELNGIIKRTVYDTQPIKVEYELTPSGQQLRVVIDAMYSWGKNHREELFGRSDI